MTQATCNNDLHAPVLCDEVVEFLVTNPSGRFLDCTGGMGGHARAILHKLTASGELWIGDYHKPTVQALQEKFISEKRIRVLCSRFSMIFDNLVPPFLGILADFGISSPQLEDPNLGIGFSIHAPLDMRLDTDLTLTASDLLQTLKENDLADVFYNYGGERAARRLARAIVFDRQQKKFYTTTTDLKLLCERVLGKFYRGKKIHPATKVFQALRIAVNHELDEVKIFFKKAPEFLAIGGRLAVISFHEGEDRLAKTMFKEWEATKRFRRLTRKAVQPSEDELKKNPRSRSARLRVLERIAD